MTKEREDGGWNTCLVRAKWENGKEKKKKKTCQVGLIDFTQTYKDPSQWLSIAAALSHLGPRLQYPSFCFIWFGMKPPAAVYLKCFPGDSLQPGLRTAD